MAKDVGGKRGVERAGKGPTVGDNDLLNHAEDVLGNSSKPRLVEVIRQLTHVVPEKMLPGAILCKNNVRACCRSTDVLLIIENRASICKVEGTTTVPSSSGNDNGARNVESIGCITPVLSICPLRTNEGVGKRGAY